MKNINVKRNGNRKNYEDGIFNGMSIMATAIALVLGGAIIYNTLRVEQTTETVEAETYNQQETREVIELTSNQDIKTNVSDIAAHATVAADSEVSGKVNTETTIVTHEVKEETPAAQTVIAAPATISASGAPVSTSTTYSYEGPTELASPKMDVHLVSVDGTIDTWCSLRTDGDYYNRDSIRFKCNADGYFYDQNGIQYVCDKVNVAQ